MNAQTYLKAVETSYFCSAKQTQVSTQTRDKQTTSMWLAIEGKLQALQWKTLRIKRETSKTKTGHLQKTLLPSLEVKIA